MSKLLPPDPPYTRASYPFASDRYFKAFDALKVGGQATWVGPPRRKFDAPATVTVVAKMPPDMLQTYMSLPECTTALRAWACDNAESVFDGDLECLWLCFKPQVYHFDAGKPGVLVRVGQEERPGGVAFVYAWARASRLTPLDVVSETALEAASTGNCGPTPSSDVSL